MLIHTCPCFCVCVSTCLVLQPGIVFSHSFCIRWCFVALGTSLFFGMHSHLWRNHSVFFFCPPHLVSMSYMGWIWFYKPFFPLSMQWVKVSLRQYRQHKYMLLFIPSRTVKKIRKCLYNFLTSKGEWMALNIWLTCLYLGHGASIQAPNYKLCHWWIRA